MPAKDLNSGEHVIRMVKDTDTKKFRVQVDKEHYYRDYDDLMRFISYFYQIDLVKKLHPGTVLEVGIGNKTVSNYLKEFGFAVTTCDFDRSLNPDHVADIRDLPFENDSFDLVMACEVLEHIPWEDVEKALYEIHRVTKKHALISIPYHSIQIEAVLRAPFIGRISGKPYLTLSLRIPRTARKEKLDKEHYWEMDRKKHSIKKVRALLEKRFRIVDEGRPALNSYHHFFVLEKL